MDTGPDQGYNFLKQKTYKWGGTLGKIDGVIVPTSQSFMYTKGLTRNQRKAMRHQMPFAGGALNTTMQFKIQGYEIENKLQASELN